MAKVIPIGQPANESERRAIGFLRDHLPSDWQIFHNFEIYRNKQVFEIDIAILAYHAMYLVDVKGTRGNISVYGSEWHPEGRDPFYSPLAKLRHHAKTMAAIIGESDTRLPDLENVYVQAAVLLTADDAEVIGLEDKDRPDVTDFKDCVQYFHDASRIPNYLLSDITGFHNQIAKVITGKARPKALVFGHWKVVDSPGHTHHYIEYRAENNWLGKSGGMARLRVYKVDPYQDEAGRTEELKKISNAYRAVEHMPAHANVLAVKDLFLAADEHEVVLVTEDLPGQALRQHINQASLTFDQKRRVMRDVLKALEHAHLHDVVHCKLTPDAILVTESGHARVTGFDFARVGTNPTSTSTDPVVNNPEAAYQVPEYPTQACIASDLNDAGRIFYELLTDDLFSSEHKPDLRKGLEEWLQKFRESDPKRHTSAASARKVLDDLTLFTDKNDLMNLPQDFILANRFRIQKKLGGGSFDVTYKVFDSMGDVVRIVKLVTTERRSMYDQLRRECTALTELPNHPHVMKAIWADRMVDAKQKPYIYIVFEYVEGRAVSDRIDAEALPLDDALRIVRETAGGLAHLHKHGVYHQDIKPANLLWTDKGVRIIGFNVAASESDEVQGDSDMHRYLPPDYDCSSAMEAPDRIDRDLYALGISFYECLTGNYPFDAPTPPIKTQPKAPRKFKGCADLNPLLVAVLVKMIAPERTERFTTAEDFLSAMAEIKHLRSVLPTGEIGTQPQVASNNKAVDGKTTFIQPVPPETPTSVPIDVRQTIPAENIEAVGAQETSLDSNLSDVSPPMPEPETSSGLGRMSAMLLLVLGATTVLILFMVRPSWWADTLAVLQELSGEPAPVVVTDILAPTTELLPTATVAVVLTATPESPTVVPDNILAPTAEPLPTATVAVVPTAMLEAPTVDPDDETEISPPVRTVAEIQPAVPYLLSTARMRAGPGEEFVDKGELEAGAEVTLIGVSGDATWFMLANRYWIPVEAVSQAPDGLSVRVPPYALVNANVRARSTADAPRIGGVQANETLVLIGRQEGTNPVGIWYQLDTGGWIFGDLVVDAPADLPEVE